MNTGGVICVTTTKSQYARVFRHTIQISVDLELSSFSTFNDIMAERMLSPPSNNESRGASNNIRSTWRSFSAIKRWCEDYVTAPKTNSMPECSSPDRSRQDSISDTEAPQANLGPTPASTPSLAMPDIGGMHQFDCDVENAVMYRYNFIFPEMLRGLAKHLNSEVKNYAKTHRMLHQRPAVLVPIERMLVYGSL